MIHEIKFQLFLRQPAAEAKCEAAAAAATAIVVAATICQMNGASGFAVRRIALGFLIVRHDS